MSTVPIPANVKIVREIRRDPVVYLCTKLFLSIGKKSFFVFSPNKRRHKQ
jgi:hypothetical protein